MSEPKHMPEPWRVFSSAQPSCIVDDAGDICRARSPLDAARIVACVNACAGMDDPAAEIALMRLAGERLATDYANADAEAVILREQRDSLAAALRACVDNYYNCGGDEQSCARAGREALAKLEGKP